MNPILPCPYCGKATDFHEDEVERVEDGSAVCMSCGLRLEEANFVLEVVAGEHPDFVERMLREEEDDEEDDETDDE